MRLTWLVIGSVLALVVLLVLRWLPETGASGGAVRSVQGPQGPGPGLDLEPSRQASSSREERAPEGGTPSLVTAPAEAEVGPTDGEPLRLLRVRFIDEESEEPLVGCSLSVFRAYARERETTLGSTDGSGEFEVRVEPGEYRAFQGGSPGDRQQGPREIRPRSCEVPRGAPDDPHLVVLRGRSPSAVLPVQVDHQYGAPAEGAWAVFSAGSEVFPSVAPFARTDANGRAWLGIWDPEEFTDGVLYAWDDQGNVSDYLPIDAPLLPGVRRLVIAPGGSVEVLVVDAQLEPVEGRSFLLSSGHEHGHQEYQDTDGAGRITFERLPPGPYLACDRGFALAATPVQLVHVRRGEVQTLEFRLEEGERVPAVSGRVVDEQGAPLAGVALVVTPEGGWSESVSTQEDGSFTFYGDEAESFLVEANLSWGGDVYEPGSVEVPFGAFDVQFTRVAQAELRTFEVEVFDLTTGAALEHFVATIDRGPASEEWSSKYAPRLEFELRVLPETRCRISSRGYVERSLELKRELDRLEEGERLRVGLAPGLDYSCSVLDADTLEPLPGVLFRSELAGDVRSDARGEVRFQATEWSVYRVSREGYEPDEWDPTDHVLWQFGSIFLVPAEGDEAEGG